MRVTDTEYVALVMMATGDNVLQSRFGPDWVELLDTPGNQWALDAQPESRAVLIEDAICKRHNLKPPKDGEA